MPRVSFAYADRAAIVAPPGTLRGEVESRALFNRVTDPIHLHLHRMTPGAELRLSGSPTDCLIYVWEGSIDATGTALIQRSSAIVERGAHLSVTGGSSGAAFLVFNMRERRADDRSGGHVHLLPSACVPRVNNAGGRLIGMALHADSRCPTCRVWLHENDFPTANEETTVHSHSEDEIIFVRAGAIRLGNRLYGPGTALAIAAHTKYGFHSGPDGLSFVNFRGQSPTYTSGDGSVILDEAELWRTTVGKPEYLTPARSPDASWHD